MTQLVSQIGRALTAGRTRITWRNIQARVLQEEISRSEKHTHGFRGPG